MSDLDLVDPWEHPRLRGAPEHLVMRLLAGAPEYLGASSTVVLCSPTPTTTRGGQRAREAPPEGARDIVMPKVEMGH